MFDAEVLERQLRDLSYGVTRRKALLKRAAERLERELQRQSAAHRAAADAMQELFRQRSRLRALNETYGRSRQPGGTFDPEPVEVDDMEETIITIDENTVFEPVMDGLVKKTPFTFEGPFTIMEPIPMSVEEALALSHADRGYLVPGYISLGLLVQRQWMDHSIFDEAVRRAAVHGIIGETLADDLCGSVIDSKVITDDAACKRFAELRQAHREGLRASGAKVADAAS